MLIIHNMYFPHGYQYTYIYFRVGVKAVAGAKSPDVQKPRDPKVQMP